MFPSGLYCKKFLIENKLILFEDVRTIVKLTSFLNDSELGKDLNSSRRNFTLYIRFENPLIPI